MNIRFTSLPAYIAATIDSAFHVHHLCNDKLIGLSLLALIVNSMLLYAQPGLGAKPVAIVAAKAEVETIGQTIEALGTLRANETVQITASVTEPVVAINFEDGQRVKAGDILVELDTAEELAELAEQQAILEEAELQTRRLTNLVEQRAASTAELDIQRREANAAKARIQAIQARIKLRRITAPFAGRVGLRNISLGALAQPQQPITTLIDDQRMKLDFDVPAVYLNTIKIGDRIEASSQAFTNQVFVGEVSSINNVIDPATRTVTVRSIMPNINSQLQPGLLMQVRLTYNLRDAIIIPEESVLINGSKHTVYQLDQVDGMTRVAAREISLGQRLRGYVEVTNGLQAGDEIVTQGLTKVKPDDTVSISTYQQRGEGLSTLLKRIEQPNKANNS